MARAKVHHVKSARKTTDRVKKGQEYWWWKYRYGGKIISHVNPNVDYMVRLTEYEANLEHFNAYEEIESREEAEDLLSEAEEFKEELQQRLENIPESLQESHILTERLEEMDEVISNIENHIETLE